MLTLRGIIPPLATPFDAQEELDEPVLRREVESVIAAGAHGITVTGSTGEGHTLSEAELVRSATTAVEAATGRVPVIAGIIRDCTRDVVRAGLALRHTGIQAIQVTPVHYLFRPDEEGTLAYYRRIGDEVGLPIIIYNVVPWNTLSPELLLRLSELTHVVAVKQSGGDIHKLARLLTLAGDRLTVLSAVDDLLFPSFLLGAQGAVAAILTVLPDLCVQLWDACKAGQIEEARQLHERILLVWDAIAGPDLPARTKTALAWRGRPVGGPRHPLLPVQPAVREQIGQALRAAKVIA
ncbi:MAG: dihydrodipicolinate synthase family protein [Chloroflexi bacterium]|nr:dihydrodipicolinate synthase family protein [Chloroflexota bacterium]